MRSTGTFAAAVALVALGTGCGPGYCDPYDPYCTYGVVDYAGVGVDPFGYCYDPTFCGCADPTVCLTSSPAAQGASTSGTACTPNDGACATQASGTAVNQALQSALMPVEALLGSRGRTSGDKTVFGPIDAGPPASHGAAAATFRFSIRHSSGTTTWKLEARPLSSSAAWVEVFTGSMVPDAQSRRGRGVLGVDLDALSTVNPSAYPGGGKLLGAFANDADQKVTAYRLTGFHLSGPPSDGLITSATLPDGHVQTTLSTAGAAPVTTTATAPPLATNGAPSPNQPDALDPGTPPAAMPDPGF